MNKEELDTVAGGDDSIRRRNFGSALRGRPAAAGGEFRASSSRLCHELSESLLTSERIESLAGVIINNNQRLLQDLKERGSCDCAYTLKNTCRFRVNIYLSERELRHGDAPPQAADSDL